MFKQIYMSKYMNVSFCPSEYFSHILSFCLCLSVALSLSLSLSLYIYIYIYIYILRERDIYILGQVKYL